MTIIAYPPPNDLNIVEPPNIKATESSDESPFSIAWHRLQAKNCHGRVKHQAANSPSMDAPNWLGCKILVESNHAAPHGFGQYSGEFYLKAPAKNLSVDFLNNRGQIVQAIELGEQRAGIITFIWDALDTDRRPLPLGLLKIRINGGTISWLTTWATVEGVKPAQGDAEAILTTQLGDFTPTDVMRFG